MHVYLSWQAAGDVPDLCLCGCEHLLHPLHSGCGALHCRHGVPAEPGWEPAGGSVWAQAVPVPCPLPGPEEPAVGPVLPGLGHGGRGSAPPLPLRAPRYNREPQRERRFHGGATLCQAPWAPGYSGLRAHMSPGTHPGTARDPGGVPAGRNPEEPFVPQTDRLRTGLQTELQGSPPCWLSQEGLAQSG